MRGIQLTHIHQHTRAEGHAVQRMAVAAERGFGFRATNQIIPDVLAQMETRGPDEFMQGHKLVGKAAGHVYSPYNRALSEIAHQRAGAEFPARIDPSGGLMPTVCGRGVLQATPRCRNGLAAK